MNVRLRPLVITDKTEMARLANNKNVWDNLRDRMPNPYSEDDAVFFISLTQNENSQRNFAIEWNGQFCGVIGLELQSDVYRDTAEVGYWIGEPFWKKGIATEAVKQVTEYGFSELKLRRIYAGIFDFNKASMKVLEKNGYSLEGIRKKAVIKNGIICEDYCYAITQ